jgi:hypothetical protein
VCAWPKVIGAALVAVLSGTLFCSAAAASPSLESVAPWMLTCGYETFPRSALKGPAVAEQEDHAASEALRQGIEDTVLPRGGWRLLFRDATTAEYARPRENGMYIWATVTNGPDDWRVTGWDFSCQAYAVRGDEQATPWIVSPNHRPLGAKERSFVAWVTPRFCHGGKPVAASRFARPVIDYLPGRVAITFFVRPSHGIWTCPLHPPTRIRVRMPRPLGDRQLINPGFEPVRRIPDRASSR